MTWRRHCRGWGDRRVAGKLAVAQWNPTMDFDRYDRIRPIRWQGNLLSLLDQRKLPFVVEYIDCVDSQAVTQAIRDLVVRGAPAIGIAAAYGVVLAGLKVDAHDGSEALAAMMPAIDELNASRPTAVNLMWAIARMHRVLAAAGSDWREVAEREARAIESEDLAANRHMGRLRAELGRAYALQYRIAGHRRFRHGTGRDPRWRRAGAHRPRLRQRNPPLVAGRAADGLGAAAGWHPRHLDRRCRRRTSDENRSGTVARGRCRPHLRQWRHRQQDRHVYPCHRCAPSRCEGDGGGAVLDRGHGHRAGQRHPHRGTRRRRT